MIRAVLESLDLPASAQLLDAGCGGGGNLAELARFGAVTGLEPSHEAARAARAREVGPVIEGTIEELPFETGTFEVAAILDVIEHLDDDRRALDQLHRVVVPGGYLLVTAPAYQRLFGPHDIANDHRRRYDTEELGGAAQAAGWQPLHLGYFNAAALPVAALHRAIQRRRLGGRPPVVSDVERTPPWMDELLLVPSRAEARWIGSGRRIAAGLSVLGVFQRVET